MDKKICQICGKVMTRKNKHVCTDRDWSKKTTCSVLCRGRWLAKKKKAKWKPKRCLFCGEYIKIRDSKRKFCNDECFRKWNRGSNIKSWKGGLKKHGKYKQRLVGKEHPFSDMHGYILEHRNVMEKWLRENDSGSKYLVEINGKKYLSPFVMLHHINRKKDDNRIENLHPFTSQREHFHFNYCPHCPHCQKKLGELLEHPNK